MRIKNSKKFFLLISLIIGSLLIDKTTNAAEIFLAMIPKCGTHALAKCMLLLTGKHNRHAAKRRAEELITFIKSLHTFLSCHAHIPYDTDTAKLLVANNIKIIIIIRDPRDYVVSLAYYMKKLPRLWPHAKNKSIDELMIEIIKGSDRLQRELGNLDEYFRSYLPWTEVPGTCVVRFENLIGPKGGGTLEAQIKEISKIAFHIGLQVDDSTIKSVANKLFGQTQTFRKGQIGDWKNHFTEEHKKLFKEIAGQLLIELDYEKDLNW